VGNDVVATFFFPSLNIFKGNVGGYIHMTAVAAPAAGNITIFSIIYHWVSGRILSIILHRRGYVQYSQGFSLCMPLLLAPFSRNVFLNDFLFHLFFLFSYLMQSVPKLDILDHIKKAENDVGISHIVKVIVYYFGNIPEAPFPIRSKLVHELIIFN
jgi:hypothetical protein